MTMQTAKWKKDTWGKEAHALFIGGLYVGSIMESHATSTHHPGEWRGWFMSDDDGDETGWFPTADAARHSVEKKLAEALAKASAD